jgi:hypothetical protein
MESSSSSGRLTSLIAAILTLKRAAIRQTIALKLDGYLEI